MQTTAVEQMRAFLRERYGIKDTKQLASRIKAAPKINIAIFTEVIPDDDSAGQTPGRVGSRTKVG